MEQKERKHRSVGTFLVRNLLTSVPVVAVAAVAVWAYEAISGKEGEWDVVAAVALGMGIASLVLAVFDARRHR